MPNHTDIDGEMERLAEAVRTVTRFLNFDAFADDGKQSPTFEAMRVVMRDYARLSADNQRLKEENAVLESKLSTARGDAIEECARLVETVIVSGPEDDEIDHDDYRDMRIAAAIRRLIIEPKRKGEETNEPG